jgi:hypothetical protein
MTGGLARVVVDVRVELDGGAPARPVAAPGAAGWGAWVLRGSGVADGGRSAPRPEPVLGWGVRMVRVFGLCGWVQYSPGCGGLWVGGARGSLVGFVVARCLPLWWVFFVPEVLL